MSLKYILNILKLLGVLGIVAFFYWGIKTEIKLENKKKQEQIGVRKKTRNSRLFKLYSKLSRIKIFKSFLRRLVQIYAIRIPGDYRKAREEAMKSALLMWAASLCVVVFVLFSKTSLYGISCAVLAAYVVCKSSVTSKMEKYDLQIIKELNLFVDDVRHYYYDLRMIPESVKEAMESSKLTLMKQHAQKLYEVLIDDDIITAAKKYNATVPDYYLRMFMAASVLVEIYGDKEVGEDLLYISSLRDLKKDIQIELTKRRTITAKFKFLSGIAIIPYFFLGPIEHFCSGMFTSLHDMYGGTFGSIAKALIFIVVCLIYTIVSKLRETVRVEEENIGFYKKIYNFGPVKKIVDQVLNKNWGKSLRLQTLLRKTGNRLTIYTFTAKRLLFFVVAFAAAIVFLFGVKIRNKQVYAEGAITATQASSGASDADCFQILVMTQYYLDKYLNVDCRLAYNQVSGKAPAQEFDSDVEKYVQSLVSSELATNAIPLDEKSCYEQVEPFLEEFSGTKSPLVNLKGKSYEEAVSSADFLVQSGMKTFKNLVSFASKPNCFEKHPDFNEAIAKTVASKVKKVQSQHFTWVDLAVAFLFAVFAYFEPYVMIMISKKSLQMDMEDEVIQFEAIILILMHIERIAQEDVLEWMCMFSRIFKPSLQKCMCNYVLENEEALKQLCIDEPFEPFRRLIEDIEMVDKNGIKVAFNGVAIDRKNYQEDRKSENEIAISNKATFAGSIAFGSMYAVVVGYVAVPFVIASIGDFSSSIEQVQSSLN